jgi:quercetin dioxygenase-like cupin family protein
MNRRDLISLTGLTALAAAFGAGDAQAQTAAGGRTRVIRLYADADGNAHVEELTVATTANGQPRQIPNIPVTAMSMRAYPGASQNANWHTAPARQFAIAIDGELEVEVSGGVRHKVGKGDLVFLEDVAGKGHVTRMQGPVTNVFLRVPADFDLVAWARG